MQEYHEQQQSLLDEEHEDDLELPHCINSSIGSARRKR